MIDLRASDLRDTAAGDLLAPKLPAEDERRQDHHLRDGVVALDVRGWVALGQARPPAPPRARPRRTLPSAIRVRMKLAVALSSPRSGDRYRTREAIDQRAEHRRSRHHGGLGAERDPAAARELGELDAVQRDRPLVRGDHRDRRAREPRACVRGQARRRRTGSPSPRRAGQPRWRGAPRWCSASTARRVARRSTSRREAKPEHGREVESVRVVDESVARIGETDDRDIDAVLGREPLRLRVETPGSHWPTVPKPTSQIRNGSPLIHRSHPPAGMGHRSTRRHPPGRSAGESSRVALLRWRCPSSS